MERIRILQALRLKGRAKAEDIATSAGLDLAVTQILLGEAQSAGHVEEARDRLKLTPAGREHLDNLLAEERQGVDQASLVAEYHRFDEHNTALKQLMTRWQLKDAETPNDHTDEQYDSAVIADLAELHDKFAPLLDAFVELAPRLAHYPTKFAAALERIDAGDRSWFARPLIDSYHTVWFELHEELIGLAGLSRVEEAAAGRAE